MENLPAGESVLREMEDTQQASPHQHATADDQLTESQSEYQGNGDEAGFLVDLSSGSGTEVLKENYIDLTQDSDDELDETHVSLHCNETFQSLRVEATSDNRSPVPLSEPISAVGESGAYPSSAGINDGGKTKRKLSDVDGFDDGQAMGSEKKRRIELSHQDQEEKGPYVQDDENSDWDVESFDEDDTNEYAQNPIDHRHPVLMELEPEPQLQTEPEQNVENVQHVQDDAHTYAWPLRRFETREQFLAYVHHEMAKIKRAHIQTVLLNQRNNVDHFRFLTAIERGREEFAHQLKVAMATRERVRKMFQTYVDARVRELVITRNRFRDNGHDA